MGPKEKKIDGTGREGKAAGKKQLERRIQALTARVTYLESSLAESDHRTGELTSELTKLAPANATVGVLKANLAAARAELNGIAQRLDVVEAGQEEGAALQGVEGRIDALGERLEQIEPQLSALGGDLEQYRLEQSALVTKINELKEHEGEREQSLGDAAGRSEDLTERQAQLDKALSTTQDRLRELEAALDTIGTTLDSAEQENTAREERVSGLLSEIEGLRESDRHREQQFEDASSQDEQLEKGLKAIEEQLQDLESAQVATGTTFDAVLEENSASEQKVAGLESAIEELRESDRQREQQLYDTAERIVRAGERDELLENALGASGDRLRHMETALDTTASTLGAMLEENSAREQKVAGLNSGIEELRTSDRQREQQLHDTAERIERAGQRDEQLENALGASGTRLHHMETALDTTGSTLDSMHEENRVRIEEVTGVQSGLRTLTWAGGAALVALTVGVLMYVSKQQTDREVMENELTLVEQRLNGVAERDGSQTQILAQEVADLRVQIRTLNAQFEALPQDGTQPDRIAANDFGQVARLSEELANLNTALTGLSGRIDDFRQDERTAPEPEDEPLIPPAGEQESQEQQPEEKQDPWKTASEQRRFTLQLLGVQNRPSLIEFAQRHRLLADSAEFETEHQGAPWFVLFHGIYESRSQAAKAARELAPSLPGTKPWVRRLPRAGNIEALEKSP